MSDDEEYERIIISRLSWCNKCENSILNGIKIENKMFTFCLCEECIKTEKIPRKNKDTKHIKINEKYTRLIYQMYTEYIMNVLLVYKVEVEYIFIMYSCHTNIVVPFLLVCT